MFQWKYGLILVEESQDKQSCQIYELYQNQNDEWTILAKPSIDSLDNVEKLYADIKADGINRWFYDNGIFLYHSDKEKWEWHKREKKCSE
jgi:hypothetical protein